MNRWTRAAFAAGLGALLSLACGSDALSSDEPEASGGRGQHPGGAGSAGELGGDVPGLELRVPVSADAFSYARLSPPAPVDLESDPAESVAWDLAFRGWEVFTNGGASGRGEGWAFGPNAYYYLYFPNDALDIPFPIPDRAAGVFQRWYAYGADHGLYSRFHVYGVASGERLFKLQVLGYRGEVGGTLVNALYRVRYAEVAAGETGAVIDLAEIDATAGGDATNPDAPSTCLELAGEALLELTPAEAATSDQWDLCFRRDVITVNGGASGPRGVTAVDLDASQTDAEDVDEVMGRTASNQLARFEAVDYEALTAAGLEYSGDRVTSAFGSQWYAEGEPRTPAEHAWYVVGADGESRAFVAFDRFDAPSADSPGAIVLRVQAVGD